MIVMSFCKRRKVLNTVEYGLKYIYSKNRYNFTNINVSDVRYNSKVLYKNMLENRWELCSFYTLLQVKTVQTEVLNLKKERPWP